MTELDLDTSAALGALQATQQETEEQRRRHTASPPGYPPAAAGAGFGGHGAALAMMLAALHEAGTTRIDALGTTTAAAVRQVHVYGDTDQGFATTLKATS
ncbi:hypothetical protein [Corynebacterium halotolerans]|uniref:hypothetical protein n=1 Tax=Corynebacterium halotolerans TaxID=225326 RepID=UPI003CF68EF9